MSALLDELGRAPVLHSGRRLCFSRCRRSGARGGAGSSGRYGTRSRGSLARSEIARSDGPSDAARYALGTENRGSFSAIPPAARLPSAAPAEYSSWRPPLGPSDSGSTYASIEGFLWDRASFRRSAHLRMQRRSMGGRRFVAATAPPPGSLPFRLIQSAGGATRRRAGALHDGAAGMELSPVPQITRGRLHLAVRRRRVYASSLVSAKRRWVTGRNPNERGKVPAISAAARAGRGTAGVAWRHAYPGWRRPGRHHKRR
jgi:hypothetical protein